MPDQNDETPDHLQDAIDALPPVDTTHSRTAVESRLIVIDQRLDALEALIPLVQSLTAQRKRRKAKTSLYR